MADLKIQPNVPTYTAPTAKVQTQLTKDRTGITKDSSGDVLSGIEGYGEAGITVLGHGLNAATSQNKYTGGTTGAAIGSGVGAIGGAFLGPAGSAIGAKVGGMIGGAIGGAGDNKKYESDALDIKRKSFEELNLDYNANPYGMEEIQFAKSGGAVKKKQVSSYENGGMEGGEEPEMEMVDIELGELLVDPMTLDVVREYNNPNRYSKHAKNPNNEPVGNFTYIKPGHIVVPKDVSDRYKGGDSLTRTSILMEILKNQRNNPPETVPSPEGPVSKAKDGIGVLPRPSEQSVIDKWKTHAEVQLGKPVYGGRVPRTVPEIQKDIVSIANPIDTPAIGTIDKARPVKELPGVEEPISYDKKGFNKVKLAQALNTLPAVLGGMNALQVDPYLKYDEPDFSQAESYAKQLPTDINIEASRNALGNANRATNLMLNNVVSPSVRAEVASNKASLLDSEGKLIQDASNFVRGAKAAKLQGLSGIAGQKSQTKFNARQMFQDMLRKDKAARENLLHSASSELVTNHGQQVMDEEQINALNSVLQHVQLKPGETRSVADTKYLSDNILSILNMNLAKAKIGGRLPK